MDSGITEAEDAFAVLASRLRLQILEALSTADDPYHSFTQLYQSVDAANTSQFAYHLNELSPHYLEETSDGYVIRGVGRRLIESINAGEYTIEPEFDPFTLATYCPHCGETAARATYDGRLATVDCESCATTLLRYDLRPAHVANRTSRNALIAADRQMRAEYGTAIDGVCQRCGGSIDAELITGREAEPTTALLTCLCAHCGTSYSAPVPIALVTHPLVVQRFTEAGLDPRTTPIWTLLPDIAEWDVETKTPSTVTVAVPECRRIRVRVGEDVDIETRP